MIDEPIEKEIRKFLSEEYQQKVLLLETEGKDRLTISFKKVIGYDPKLAEELVNNPTEFLKATEVALKDIIKIENTDHEITVRIKDLTSNFNTRIRDVRAKHLSKLISVKGQVNTVSDVRPMIIKATFECPNCTNATTKFQFGKNLVYPQICDCGRKGKQKCIDKEYADTQRIVVEELIETLEGNEQPRKINIVLTKGLTSPELDKYNCPGNRILVNGILEERAKGKEDEATEREFLLVANHIEPLEEDYRDIEIGSEEEKKIKELSEKENILDLMVQSYAPDISGHEMIKKAIILQLFGGNNVYMNEKLIRRGNSHVLLIGEPGTAKTKLVKFATLIAPKSRYSSGTGATGVGLTATVHKDDFIGGWALEAGVIPLANGGVAVLDELDKISVEERGKLHEAMSEGELNINKATIHAKLKTDTAVLAAANPKMGRFDYHEPIANQLDLGAPLLSRFDFIYPVKDMVDKDKDEAIIRTMLRLHSEKDKILEPPVNIELFRKYIAFSKKMPDVRMTKAAQDAIAEIYHQLRQMGMKGTERHIPITARYGEALIRLSQAACKARLKRNVTELHVEDARQVLMFSLEQLAWDPDTGTLDIDRLETGFSSSKRQVMQAILRVMRQKVEETKHETVPAEDIVAAVKEQCSVDELLVDDLLTKLSQQGEIYQPRNGFWAIVK